jgi:dihydrofolate reductase
LIRVVQYWQGEVMRMKIKCTLAISLDGYIADEHGGYDWILGDGNKDNDTEKAWDFDAFMNDVDVVVMGRNCYDQDMHKEFSNKGSHRDYIP